LVVRGTITVGAFVAFGLYLGMLTWPLIALGWVVNLFQRGAASMTRLRDTLAVVGATGSGKSALIDLIPRLADPQEGEILLDGIPIKALSLEDLRAEIGYVQQESFLFSDTIAANLAYGDATH